MKRFNKGVILVTFVFILRIIQSCCDCSEAIALFELVELTHQNANNTGDYTTVQTSDSMPAKAVSFKLELIGDKEYYSQTINTFQNSYACDCTYPLYPDREITGIKITTLSPLNEAKAGDDISNKFVAEGDDLYVNLEYKLKKLNTTSFDYNNEYNIYYEFDIFCTDSIQNDSIKLVFEILLSGTSSLKDTSSTIYISH